MAKLLIGPRQARELALAAPHLHELLEDAAACAPAGVEVLVVGDVHRTADEEEAIRATGIQTSGVHEVGPPYRAIDLNYAGDNWTELMAWAARINPGWVYDDSRPGKLCAFAQPHGTGPHLHLQVHPATRRRLEPASSQTA